MTTNNLTELWKKGGLEEGYYYLKDNEYTFIDQFNGVSFEETCDFEIKEVLAPVPSFNEWQPFTDPYFRGLTTKDIAELAKKSIRLCKQSCEDNTTIQNLKELLGYCADILEEWDDKDRDIEILLEEVDEALK